jgi:hypothetical protein
MDSADSKHEMPKSAVQQTFPVLIPSMLPLAVPVMTFKDSTYFKQDHHKCTLPCPAEVRRLSKQRGHNHRSSPLAFPHLGLLVKFGTDVFIPEAQTMWAVRKLFGSTVPVPELYGWCLEGRELFIYMQLMQGDRLKDRWTSLTNIEKSAICDQLFGIVHLIRQVNQDQSDQFIGKSSLMIAEHFNN